MIEEGIKEFPVGKGGTEPPDKSQHDLYYQYLLSFRVRFLNFFSFLSYLSLFLDVYI